MTAARTVYLTEEWWELAQDLAEKLGVSRSTVIRLALQELAKQNGVKRPESAASR